MTSAGAFGEKEQEIQYDLSESAQNKKAKAGKMKLKVQEQPLKSRVTKSKQKGIFVQTGSFSNEDSAKQVLQETQKFYKGRIEEAQAGEKTIYRVLLGPFANSKKAKDIVLKIKNSGRDAIVVKNR
jgi:cell division septation protein DedD